MAYDDPTQCKVGSVGGALRTQFQNEAIRPTPTLQSGLAETMQQARILSDLVEQLSQRLAPVLYDGPTPAGRSLVAPPENGIAGTCAVVLEVRGIHGILSETRMRVAHLISSLEI